MAMKKDNVCRIPRKIDRQTIFKDKFVKVVLERLENIPIEVENFIMDGKIYWNGDIQLKKGKVITHYHYTEMFWSCTRRIPTGVHEVSEMESFKPRRPLAVLFKFFVSYIKTPKIFQSQFRICGD